MGNKLTSSKKIYKHAERYEECEIPRIGRYTIFRLKPAIQNPRKAQLAAQSQHLAPKLYQKVYNSTQFGVEEADVEKLISKVISLPHEICEVCVTRRYRESIGLCASRLAIEATYLGMGEITLEAICKKRLFLGVEGFSFLSFLAEVGAYLQESMDFFPKLSLDVMFPDERGGIKIINPYFYDCYISNIFIVRTP